MLSQFIELPHRHVVVVCSKCAPLMRLPYTPRSSTVSDSWFCLRKGLNPSSSWTRNESLRLVLALTRAHVIASAILEVARIAFSLLTPYLLQVIESRQRVCDECVINIYLMAIAV